MKPVDSKTFLVWEIGGCRYLCQWRGTGTLSDGIKVHHVIYYGGALDGMTDTIPVMDPTLRPTDSPWRKNENSR